MSSLEGVAGVASAEYTRSVVSLDSLGREPAGCSSPRPRCPRSPRSPSA
ncbi:hypothetical protein G7085_13725 [Tessaracoccus sp. HDW20]|nr:hypothetical protein [Tessaracoccus coleopterorum]NHB85322.1 hypothetical protein [Tessaracoccus coleopterorum]